VAGVGGGREGRKEGGREGREAMGMYTRFMEGVPSALVAVDVL
jgi:hypothetical protein